MDYKERYEQALERAEELLDSPRTCFDIEQLKDIFPELAESEDERIRKALVKQFGGCIKDEEFCHTGFTYAEITAWLEKQKEQKPVMLQWTGKNLKEVIDFTGKSPRFDEWFKSWEEFENYVHSHDDILKLFCEDGCHYEVPVGAWIVKTPDGYNIPSRFRFVQKPAEWSEEDERMLNELITIMDGGIVTSGTYLSEYVAWLKSLPERFNLQLKQEWSDTDNIGWDEAFACVTRAEEAAKNEEELQNAVTAEKWLKEIKFKYHVHPVKQKWSKEDEETIRDAINRIEQLDHYWNRPRDERLIKRLKSLRPQPKQEWSEEDEEISNSILNLICSQITYVTGQGTMSGKQYPTYSRERDWFMNRLKSLRPPQDRCQDCPHRGDMFLLTQGFKSGKHDLAIKFMNYLDENRPEGKMGLSNAECEDIDKAFKENDWAKIIRYYEKYGRRD